MELQNVGQMRKKQGGMIHIEISIIFIFTLIIMKLGFQNLLQPHKKALQEIQQKRIIYDGKQLWKD